MYTQTLLVTLLAAVAQARLGQEQGNGAIQGVAELVDLGKPGEAPALAGNGIQFLLAAASPCDKLTHADKIIQTLGNSDRAVEAARRYVAAEQNFNPSNTDKPMLCGDPTLPASKELRGVVPLVDPAVTGQEIENQNAETSIKTPFNADGLSVADVAKAQGFDNFDVSGGKGVNAASSSEGKGGGSGGDTGAQSSQDAPDEDNKDADKKDHKDKSDSESR